MSSQAVKTRVYPVGDHWTLRWQTPEMADSAFWDFPDKQAALDTETRLKADRTPGMVLVAFSGVGGDRINWLEELTEFSGQAILRALGRARAFTRAPDIDYDLAKGTGRIWLFGRIPQGVFAVLNG